jgi:ribonuclease HI
MQGEYKLAEKAYTGLFDILEMGQEPGYLPGDPDSSKMLKTDLDEQVALFLRSVYMNSASEKRPDTLYKAMNEFGYLARQVKLRNLMNALDSLLPDFETFILEWIKFLKNQKSGTNVSELLREAVLIKGGTPAISEFARQNVDKYPRAYIDWIAALKAEEDTESVIQVAREAMSEIPRDYTVRAEVAETISRIGEKLNDNMLKLEGYGESFYSNPSIGYLLDLYITAIECGRFEEVRDKAEQRITELQSKGKITVSDYYDGELNTSSVSRRVLFNTLLLGGRYEKVFEMCKGNGPLGWSSGENPMPLFVTFMMVLLSKEGIYSKVLVKQWEDAIAYIGYRAEKEYTEKYKKIIKSIKGFIQINSEQEEFYLKWCKDEIGRRIDAIVSNQHRGSYHKAAGLLVAMAETLANRGKKLEGIDLIERYRNKYPRHSSFKSEITQAFQASGL